MSVLCRQVFRYIYLIVLSGLMFMSHTNGQQCCGIKLGCFDVRCLQWVSFQTHLCVCSPVFITWVNALSVH